MPRLRFRTNKIVQIAARYEYPLSESELIDFRPTVFQRGYLLRNELAHLAYWKAPRSAGHIEKNTEKYVNEITGFALRAKTERARIELLTVLSGVSWPTASVILHFFHRDPYPIIDFRALWSASLSVPSQYDFGFWWSYVKFCRKVACLAGVDMRTLDRAMWHYSKENE